MKASGTVEAVLSVDVSSQLSGRIAEVFVNFNDNIKAGQPIAQIDPERGYPLTKATLRDRTVGMVGMGAIGQAIGRQLDAMKVPVVYHSRRPAAGVA